MDRTTVQAEMARSEFGATVIANTTNLGFCAANNQAFAAARGQFIALLNNDAEAAPDFLANLRRAFDQEPDIGMAAAKVLVWEDPRRIDKAGHLIYPDGQNRGRGTGEIDQGQYDCAGECLWPDGSAAMYRKAMIEAIGGFDEDFFMFADDAELGLRGADRLVGRCLFMPGAVARHHRVRQPGCGLDQAHSLPDRTQSCAAGRQAIPLESIAAESLLLRVASGSQRDRAAAAGDKGMKRWCVFPA